MAKFKLTNLKFEQIMKDFAEIRETTIPNAVHMNARLLCVELARRTQPFGNKTGGDKVGASAVARDLLGGKKRYGIFAPITDFMAANAEEFSTGNIRLFAKKDGTVYGTDKAHFLPSANASTLRSIHKEKFTGGRISSAGGRTRDIGRWKFIDRFFVPPSTLAKYVADQQTKVGLAKSGWADCAKQLRKVVSGAMTRGIPRWVTRHLGDHGFGDVQDKTSNFFNPTVVLTNSCKYADRVLPSTEQLMAQNVVAEKMKKQMAMILKKRITKLQEVA
jgi:hypothetical protein